MAFSRSGLTKVGSGVGDAPSVWAYITADTIATVNTADYFLDAINEMKLYDTVIVTSSTGGTPAQSICYVNANNGTTIDVTDGLTVTATDTD